MHTRRSLDVVVFDENLAENGRRAEQERDELPEEDGLPDVPEIEIEKNERRRSISYYVHNTICSNLCLLSLPHFPHPLLDVRGSSEYVDEFLAQGLG